MRRHLLLLIPLAIALAVPWSGCENPSWWSLPDDLVTFDSVSIEGKVYLISPYGDRVIEVDRATREVRSVVVGKTPHVLTVDQGSEDPTHVYTINRDDHSLSVVDVTDFEAAPDELQLRPFFDTLVFSPDGTRAISYIAGEITAEDLEGQGSVNRNEIAILDLAGDERAVEFRTLDARPTDVIWAPDGTKALIPLTTDMSVLYLPEEGDIDVVDYPFSLDSADPAEPSLVETSPDGQRAFAAVSGESDVYIIDLDLRLFETLIPTPFSPTDIQVTADGEHTVVVGGSSKVVIFDNEVFEPETLTIDSYARRIVAAGTAEEPVLLLYNDTQVASTFTAITFDEGAPEVETFVTEAGITDIQVDPTGQTAVIMHAENSFGAGGVSLFNLEESQPSYIDLETPAHSMTFLETEDETVEPIGYVMVVLKEARTLVRIGLTEYDRVNISVAENPELVQPLHHDATFVYVIHDHPTGLITFLNPYRPLALPSGFPTVYGYGLEGLLD